MTTNFLNDTIAAISTPPGQGGIGVVRLSGQRAVEIADKVFSASDKKTLAQAATHTVHHGRILAEDGAVLDEVLATVMRRPRSYTGEDVVELSGHGGMVVMKLLLERVLVFGARLADPGEFTRRAFLNGRMDLVQAEAVLDMIRARTEAFLRITAGQLQGELTKELEAIREGLFDLYLRIEAVVNFPEDDAGDFDWKIFREQLAEASKRISALLATREEGHFLKEGLRVVICGRTNVGKSSLLNLFLRQPRAIVSPQAGTTRDTIEETAQIRGVPVHFVDTAGFLTPRDDVEKEAIQRSRRLLDQSDVALFVLDGSRPIADDDAQIRDLLMARRVIVVLNKTDLPGVLSGKDVEKFFPGKKVCPMSARTKAGFERLQQTLIQEVLKEHHQDAPRLILTNVRHWQALHECRQVLNRVLDGSSLPIPPEFLAEELKTSVNALDAITGRRVDVDLLDKIFSNFCIGK